MKQLVMFVLLGVVCLLVVASAAAYVSPPATNAGTHSLLTCLYPFPTGGQGVLGGTGDSKGGISSSTDLYLTIGYGALTQAEVNNFLGAEYGSIAINHYDPTTNPPTIGSAAVPTISWGNSKVKNQTDVSLWTLPVGVNDPTLNGGKPFWATRLFAHVGVLPSGTYWVSPDIELTQSEFDGSTTTKKGPWFNTGCEMIVS